MNYKAFPELRVKCKRLSELNYQQLIGQTKFFLSESPMFWKYFWKYIWKYFKDSNQKTVHPSSVKLKHETSTNPIKSANLFFKNVLSVFSQTLNSNLQTIQPNLPYDLSSFSTFIPDYVLSSLEHVQNIRSNVPDDTSECLHHNCHYSLTLTLAFILICFRQYFILQCLENLSNFKIS